MAVDYQVPTWAREPRRLFRTPQSTPFGIRWFPIEDLEPEEEPNPQEGGSGFRSAEEAELDAHRDLERSRRRRLN